MNKPDVLSDEELDKAWPNMTSTGQALYPLSFEMIALELLRCAKVIAQAQRDADVEWFKKQGHEAISYLEGYQQAKEDTAREIKELALKAIQDEPEFPSNMPNELWVEMNGNRHTTEIVMRNAVRLTKENIIERFEQSVKDKYLKK